MTAPSTVQRSRKAALLVHQEATEGTYIAPTTSTDGVLIEQPSISWKPNVVSTDEVNPSLDGFGSIVGGMTGELSFPLFPRGMGPGISIEGAPLLTACGMNEVLVASAAIIGTGLTVGTDTTMLTFGSAPTTALQPGMPLILGDNTISDTSPVTGIIARVIDTTHVQLTDQITGTPTNYRVPPCAVYLPSSGDAPSNSIALYMDKMLHSFTGGRGDPSFSVDSGGVLKATIKVMCLYQAKADATMPSVPYNTARPIPWKNGVMKIGGLAAKVKTFSLAAGNQMTHPDDPNALEGYGPPIITSRKITGSIDPLETPIATQDLMTSFRSGTKYTLHARWGATPGYRLALTVGQALAVNLTPGDRNGLVKRDISFEAVGQDNGYALTVF